MLIITISESIPIIDLKNNHKFFRNNFFLSKNIQTFDYNENNWYPLRDGLSFLTLQSGPTSKGIWSFGNNTERDLKFFLSIYFF